MLLELLSELLEVDDVLFIVKNNGVVSEIRSNSLGIHQKEKWIIIGDNYGPAHMHVDSELIKSAEFMQEEKSKRTIYSVRFYNETGDHILAAFFTKMYDESKNLISERKKVYDKLNQKYGSLIKF